VFSLVVSRFSCRKFKKAAKDMGLACPDLRLLEGGYRAFFNRWVEHCEPRGYVQETQADRDARF
jgi:hypothetical protein